MTEQREVTITADHSWVAVICLTVLLILCMGDPDLLDAIIHHLMKPT